MKDSAKSKMMEMGAKNLLKMMAGDKDTSPEFQKALAAFMGAKFDTFEPQTIELSHAFNYVASDHPPEQKVTYATVIDGNGELRKLILV